MENAQQLARSMAKWCKDPSTIYAACKNSFSRGIPKRSAIEAMVAKHHARKEPRYCEDFNDNGEDWRPRSLVRKVNDDIPRGPRAAPEPKRSRDYITVWNPDECRPVLHHHGNPFLASVSKIRAITDSVARDFDLTGDELRSNGKRRRVVVPRFIAYRLALDWGYSTPQIGRAIGDRDHSTVINGIEKLPTYLRSDGKARLCYERHKALLAEARAELERHLQAAEAAA